ncbi:transporter substrate-binding domain-containing protein [soil metagenome]
MSRCLSASRSLQPCTRAAPGGLFILVALLSLSLSLLLLPRASIAAGPTPAAIGCKQLIASGNPQYPPYLWRDPADEAHLIGANADLLQLLAKELGTPIELRYVGPWGRVQEETRAGHVDLIAGAFWTLQRTEYMDYFYPAFRETRSVVWARQSAKLSYRRWSDLAGLHGVNVINNSFGEEFDHYARESLTMSQVASVEQAFLMLQRSRADYLIYEESPGQAYLSKLNLTGLKPLSPPVANEHLFLTLSHKSSCNTGDLRGRIARAMYKLQKLGVMSGLIEKNIERWRRQTVP